MPRRDESGLFPYWSKPFSSESGIGPDLLTEAIGGRLRAQYDALTREILPDELGRLVTRLAELQPLLRRQPPST